MKNMRRGILFYFSLLYLTAVCSCYSNQHPNNRSIGIDKQDVFLLTKNDSSLIENNLKRSIKVDTLRTQTGCSMTLKFYDSSNHLLTIMNRQLCMSDTRMIWSFETHFDNSGKQILKIARDGLNKIVELKRLH